jgi:hypothetical protein
VIETGFCQTGYRLVWRSLADVERAVHAGTAGMSRAHNTEEAMLRLRQHIQFESVVTKPRTTLSRIAKRLLPVARPLLYAVYLRRAVWPTIFVLEDGAAAGRHNRG